MKVLLIDTCGEFGSLALAEGDVVIASEMMPARSSSSLLLSAMKRLLAAQGRSVQGIEAVGVVAGPGSFTGVRVGLATAKGICLATGAALAVVSRLEVMLESHSDCIAVLDAGRGEFYVRKGDVESLCEAAALERKARGMRVIVAEAKLQSALLGLHPGLSVQLRELTAASVLPSVWRCLRLGGSDLALADANYVRGEREIYMRTHTEGGERS